MAETEESSSGTLATLSAKDRMALQFEIEQFLYHEAALLDARRYDDWLELVADDIHYWMPIRRTVTLDNLEREFTKPGDMAFFDDDIMEVKMRVSKLYSGASWSEDPPSRTRHYVSNVRVMEIDGDEIDVELNFRLYRSRLNSLVDDWTGRRNDRLRRNGDGFLICRRHIFIDQTVVPSTNFSNIF